MTNQEIIFEAWISFLEEGKLTDRTKKILRLIDSTYNLLGFHLNNVNVKLMVNDINETFENIDIKVIHSAIENGSLGLFGDVHNLSTQEICIWIRKEIRFMTKTGYKYPELQNIIIGKSNKK